MNGLMDMNIDGMPFGEIMNQAVKLKTHQAKPDRYRWDAWPKFKQNTMFTKEDVEAARSHTNFEDRLKAAYELKEVADTMFRGKMFLDAAYKYEHAISVFRWLTNKDAGWKKKGILDSDIEEHEYKPASEEEESKVNAFLVACYLNIARLYHKKKDTVTAIQACDFALDIDQTCDKALLLRAQVRLAPKSAGATEQDLSYKDATLAQKILATKLLELDDKVKANAKRIKVPKKQKEEKSSDSLEDNEEGDSIDKSIDEEDESKLLELGEDGAFDLDHASSSSTFPTSGDVQEKEGIDFTFDDTDESVIAKKEVLKRCREVGKYVLSLKTDRVKQKHLDKEWSGVFEKGVIYDPSTISQEDPDGKLMEASMVNQLTDAQRLLQMYEQNNMHDDADRIRKEVEQTKKNFERVNQKRKERQAKGEHPDPKKVPPVDFFNPTEEMKRDAKEKGLDLDDPTVLQMLQRLQKSHETCGTEMTDESIGLAFDQESKQAMEKLEADVRPLISEMTASELRDALKMLNCSVTHENGARFNHDELINAMVKLVIQKAESGETMPQLGKLSKPSISSRFTSSLSLFMNSVLKFLHLKKEEDFIVGKGLENDQVNRGNRGGNKSIAQLQRETEEQQAMTFRITFVLASLFFMFRLWYSGNLSTLFDLIQNGDIGVRNHHYEDDLEDYGGGGDLGFLNNGRRRGDFNDDGEF